MNKIISAFKVYYSQKILIIALLGFSGGIPLALTGSILKVWLLEYGVNIQTIGLFALVSLPYTLKFLWAPLMDNIKLPLLEQLGRRRSWIVLSQFSLCLCLIGLGYAGSLGNLTMISFFAVATAFASASQDIVIDAYRIEILAEDEQGAGAGIYVYGYRVAMLVSGAGSLVLAENLNWGTAYITMACLVSLLILVTIFAKEPKKVALKPATTLGEWLHESVVSPFADFVKKDKWLLILLFIIFYKFCDAFAGNLTAPFLRDIGFKKSEIAMVAQTFGLVATLLGVLTGGLMVKPMSLVKALWLGGILQAFSNFVFVIQASVGAKISYLFFSIAIENFSGGVGTAIFLAYLATLCNRKYTATQYALLTSLSAIGRSFLSSSAGYFVAFLGWKMFFALSVLMSLPGLILLCIITNCLKKSKNKS